MRKGFICPCYQNRNNEQEEVSWSCGFKMFHVLGQKNILVAEDWTKDSSFLKVKKRSYSIQEEVEEDKAP